MWVPKCAGRLLRESDTGHYYSNMHIKACFVLQSPDTDGQFGVPAADGPARVECFCKYNERGAIANMQMSVVASSKRVSDKVDGPFPPIVLRGLLGTSCCIVQWSRSGNRRPKGTG